MCMQVDVLVIGCGIAGAAAALRLAQDRERQILVITRTNNPEESNTRYAQGGIVGRGPQDSAEALAHDIETAGAGLCLPSAVRILSEEGPARVRDVLIDDAGVHFDRDGNGELACTREGGHSTRRILHVGDATGYAIAKALTAKLAELPNVTLATGLTAVDLITSSHHDRNVLVRYEPITCYGAYVLDRREDSIHRILAGTTVLATGGFCRIYRYSTNPDGSRGDALARAYRAGARILNAEFVQFHPTTLAVTGADNFLISEAVRGEGARLYTPDGRHFMDDYAPAWGDLAPRDIVARAIHGEMVAHGYPHVLLDLASHMKPSDIRQRFPTIHATCHAVGIDITDGPIPVVPAAHYSCGGVFADEWGRTTIRGLYAVGEVACTGLHGANRLASTSLLEGLVWGTRAAQHIASAAHCHNAKLGDVPPWESAEGSAEPDPALLLHDRSTIQNTMWLYVGLTRNAHRLARASRDLDHLWDAIEMFYRTSRVTDDLIGLRNMAQTACVVAHAAWQNRSSRGVHYREDSREVTSTNLHDPWENWSSVGLEF